MTPAEARDELWRRGNLGWKLYPCQKPVYEAYKASDERLFLFEIGRQFGKSIIAAVLFCEQAIKHPGSVMHYAAPTGKMVENIFVPNLRIISEDAPDDCKPVVKAGLGRVDFPNGSVIHMAGCEDDLKADRLRGPFSHFALVDEGGFIKGLPYVVKSILGPQLMRTGGRILVASTPSRRVGHPFTAMCIQAEANGNHVRRNIMDSTHNGRPEIVQEFKALCGGGDPKVGELTPEWLIEYMCNRAVSSTRAIVPEFGTHRDSVVCEREIPRYYDAYVAMDPGWDPSLTAILFAIYDFRSGCVYVIDELVYPEMRTDELADDINGKEAEHWGGDFERWKEERPFVSEMGEVYLRTSDVDLRLIQDMANLHNLNFSKAIKDNKDAAINDLRVGIQGGKLKIHPRCKQLIAHLEAGTWNAKRTQFDFIDGLGHVDAVDALLYLWRSIDWSHNPYPSDAFKGGPDYFTRPGAPNPEAEALKDLFA